MNTKHINMLLGKLRTRLSGREITDEDYYETEEVAAVGPDEMFDYFAGRLDDEEMARIEKLANESTVFLSDLIGIGEIALADQRVSESPSWHDVRNLSTEPVNRLVTTPASLRRGALSFDLSSIHMAAADSSQSKPLSWILPSGLDVEVFEDGDRLVIDMTTRDLSLAGKLFGYTLRDETTNTIGMVLLHLGPSGVVSADIELERSQIAGKCELNVFPVGSEDLSCGDTDFLVRAIRRDRASGVPMDHWRQWRKVVAESDDAKGLAGLLGSVDFELNN